MANNSPTLVMASLSDDQLKKSIDSLVTHVDEAMKKMVQSTNNAVGEMEAKLKSLGNLKIDTGGSNDGGTGRRTQQHEKLTKAVNDASEAVSKETQKLQDLQQSLSGASDREQNFISQKERAANTIAQENELLNKQQSELSGLRTQQAGVTQEVEKYAQASRNASSLRTKYEKSVSLADQLEKEYEKLKSMPDQSELLKKYNKDVEKFAADLKANLEKVRSARRESIGFGTTDNWLSIGSIDTIARHGIDKYTKDYINRLKEIARKELYSQAGDFDFKAGRTDGLKEIRQYIQDIKSTRERLQGILKSKDFEFYKPEGLKAAIQYYKDIEKEYTAIEKRLSGLHGKYQTAMSAPDNSVKIADAQIKLSQAYNDVVVNAKAVTKAEGEVFAAREKSAQASQQKAQIDSQVAAKEKEIAETNGRIATATREQTEAERNANQAAKEKANIQSQVANQEKQVAEAKKQLTTATQQQTEVEKQSVQNVAQQTAARDKQIKKNQEVATSFDQIAAAQQKAVQSQGDNTLKKSFNKQELQQYIDRLRELQAEYIKVNTQEGGGAKSDKIKADMRNLEELIAKYREILKNLDYVNSRQGTIDVKKWVQDLGAVDDRYKKLTRWYTVLEKEDQRRIASEEKANQKRLADLEKEKAAQDKVIKSYQDSVLKAEFGNVMKMPTSNIDEIRAKFERLSTIIANIRELGILSPEKIASADSEVKKLGASIQRYEKFEQERIAAEQKFIVEQAKEVEQTQTLEGRVRGLAQAAREYFKANNDNRLSMSAYGKGLTVYAEGDVRAKGLSIEEQIRRQLEAEQQIIQQQVSTSQQLNNERKKYVSPTINDDAYQITRNAIARKLGINTSDVINADAQYDSIKRVGNALKQLQDAYARMTNEERNSPIGKQIIRQMQELERQTQQLRAQMSRPISLKDAMGLSEKTLDDIAYKMRQLASYRSGLNVETQTKEINQVNAKYAELQKRMNDIMQKNTDMIASNTALGRSWNYMKNRLAFYVTVGAGTSFIKQLIDIRSQYEMNEKALGILLDSASRGTRIFNELSQMALVSPYTLIELSNAAKQLTAYDIAAKDVVDTTRRLADMASAVGVPVERLTYALGQIKAYGYLNSRDARMFANAGIPLVKQLSDYYTELEGRLVSTADVYDRIKKKAIDYNEVMEVINKMTDQGGKFFDFQAKMADTLKVRLANLTLAWNNMLNDMGKESQGVLTWGIGALREMFLRWKQLDSLIKNAAWALGIRTALMFIAYSALKVGAALGVTTKQMALSAVFGKRLADVLKTVAATMKTVAMSKWTWISLFAIAAVEATQAIFGVNEAQKALNESIRNGAKDNYNNISKFLEQYKEVRDSLYSTQKVAIGSIYNPTTRKAEATAYAEQQVEQDIDKNEAKKAWEAIREQIELTVVSSDKYIGNLLSISNMSERVRQGFNLLDDVQVVNAALKELDDDTISVSKDLSAWWNAWQAPDGLIGNLKDYQETLNDIIAEYGTLESFRENTFLGGKGSDDLNDYETALERFRDDLQETTDSIINFIELKGWSGDESKINQVFEQITQKLVLDNQLDPQKAFTLQTEVEEARSKAAKEALLQRINDEKAAYKISHDESVRQALNADIERYNSWNETNGRSKVEWERFTKWLKEQHISETTAMFRNMDAEDIKSLNFQEGKHAEWVTRMVTQYAKEHKMSYDEAFKYLRSWVRSANQWSIYIPLTISTEDKKSVYDQLGEYDKAVDEADAQIERLTKRINELNAKKKKSKEETEELGRAEQELADARKAKAEAEAKGGHGKKEKKDKRAANKSAKQAETELQKALKDELSTIDKVRSIYKDLTKEGMSHANAVERATRGWDETVNAINRVLQKNGLKKLDLSKFAGIENPRELVNMLQSQLNTLLKRGAKPAEIKEFQTKINTLWVDVDKYDLSMVTKGLNNELGKLKDEYELAVELDANPELGDMFADMFGINTSTLPKTFGDALDRAQTIINRKLAEMKISTPFDLMQSNIDDFVKSTGLDRDSAVIKELVAAQNSYRDMFKKNITETEKVLDDYIKKYGDYSDKIAEIEASRLEKLKKLNEAYYTEEMRKRPEYIAKLNAIEQGANKEKQQVDFDEFKNSRYYTMMFENLDYISTKTIRDMRDRVRELIDTMNDLTPEQLKTLMSQYEKLEQKLVKRSPFKTLTKDVKEYFATTKERKAANIEFKNAQKEYDAQKKNVAALKEKYEQAKANSNTSKSRLDFLQIEIDGENEILQILKQQLDAAQKKADKYNLTAKLAKSEALAVAQVVGQNLQSLGELRDFLQQDLGVELSDELNGLVDGLSKVGQGINKITSSATSGDVVGVITGVGQTIYGLYDGIASIFGGGSAGDKKIVRQIEESEKAVKRLELAYKNLEVAIDEAYGANVIGAKQAAIANKELQLAELQRQLALEKSRDSKERDDDRIIELQGQIIDLQNDIKRSAQEIATELLGISSVGDAALSFMDAYISALRKGEDAQAAFTGSWKEMIANMIKQLWVTKVIGPQLEALVDDMNKRISERSKPQAEAYEKAKDKETRLSTMNGKEILSEMTGIPIELITWDMVEQYKDLIEKYVSSVHADVEKTKKELNEATVPTIEDMDMVAQGGKDLLPLLQASDEQLNELLKRYGLYEDQSDKTLSSLQQGIAGVSEETASAVEAYLNGMSQQAYLRNDLLVQIRDTIMSFDMDVQLGVFSQMLLQLQNNYIVMQSMQSMMEGWTTPSGQGIRVELLS